MPPKRLKKSPKGSGGGGGGARRPSPSSGGPSSGGRCSGISSWCNNSGISSESGLRFGGVFARRLLRLTVFPDKVLIGGSSFEDPAAAFFTTTLARGLRFRLGVVALLEVDGPAFALELEAVFAFALAVACAIMRLA